MIRFIFALLFVTFVQATELTPDNWEEVTSGKSVFIKYFAPWCGHCKRLKPDWDKLTEKYEDSDTTLVAEVDCTAAGKPLCDSAGVKGFPTLKYGSPSDLQDYKQARDFDTLDTFTSELKPPCDVKTFNFLLRRPKS